VGIYAEYIDRQFNFEQLCAERKAQLTRIAQIRQRDLLVYAADIRKGGAPISITYEDLLPFFDVLSGLTSRNVDIIIETPGGLGEVTEDIVRALRSKFDSVAFIVPGTAKSAGTIMVMSGDEILMHPMTSALGPIDAQLRWQDKVFSAEAFLKGIERIKDECLKTNALNRAYIPILQNIHPGELQHAENALEFATKLVTNWLATYKFKDWDTHSSTGALVTPAEKETRAAEVAKQLCDHSRWLSHGRSIKLKDLVAMRVRVTDYSQNADLDDAIRRYHTLLQMTFDTNIYKVFESPTGQIYKMLQQQQRNAPVPSPGGVPPDTKHLVADINCARCSTPLRLQLNFEPNQPIQAGCAPYPQTDRVPCGKCGLELNLSELRAQAEKIANKQVVT